MQVNIHAVWKNQSKMELYAQRAHRRYTDLGKLGCLYEEFDGETSATRYLFSEAFESKLAGCAEIPAARLQERLPDALELVEENEILVNCSLYQWIEAVQKSYCDFVELCERKEKATGEPVLICVD